MRARHLVASLAYYGHILTAFDKLRHDLVIVGVKPGLYGEIFVFRGNMPLTSYIVKKLDFLAGHTCYQG